MAATVKKHYKGTYRVSYPDAARFGQIRRYSKRLWIAEIRNTETGTLLRHAGIWETRQDAIEECEGILNH